MFDSPDTVAVYVHIPWCASKCWYCDFNSHAHATPPEREYTDALLAEWRARLDEAGGPVASIYFGGGTPSSFSPDAIARVIRALRADADVVDDVEITLEANPGTVDSARIAGFAEAGVNRISLGVQSLDPDVLVKLGRRHSPEDVIRAALAVRAANVTNFNLDLMFGIPERPAGRLERDLDELLALDSPHVSAYCLTIYDDTHLGRERRRGRRAEMGEDDASDEFARVCERLEASGRPQYEIANFGRPGFESRHNTHYWLRGRYIGLGAGAYSFFHAPGDPTGVRFENEKSPESYMDRIGETLSARVWEERLTMDQALGEAMFLGLRRIAGIDPAKIAERYGVDPRERFRSELTELGERGWITDDGASISLTREGLFVSDEVFCRFV
ncbi:MAG: radical SAM family heme chaperone HemW [Deltaproteobacteria bacterium]|nr:radical SAM family heme chaperone HemW [Deltaproteobacteria bacterium]